MSFAYFFFYLCSILPLESIQISWPVGGGLPPPFEGVGAAGEALWPEEEVWPLPGEALESKESTLWCPVRLSTTARMWARIPTPPSPKPISPATPATATGCLRWGVARSPSTGASGGPGGAAGGGFLGGAMPVERRAITDAVEPRLTIAPTPIRDLTTAGRTSPFLEGRMRSTLTEDWPQNIRPGGMGPSKGLDAGCLSPIPNRCLRTSCRVGRFFKLGMDSSSLHSTTRFRKCPE